MSDNYLYSPLRREKRGALAAQLRLYQAHQAKANGEPINILFIRCMLCDIKCQPEVMHLHEIIARGLIGNKAALEYLPLELHALLCPQCNMNRADHQNARNLLLGYSVRLWGRERVEAAVDEFNAYLRGVGGMPISPLVIDYGMLGE